MCAASWRWGRGVVIVQRPLFRKHVQRPFVHRHFVGGYERSSVKAASPHSGAFRQPVVMRREGGNRAMKPMRQVLLVDGNPADATPAREALTGGRFQSCRISVESPFLFAGSSGYLGVSSDMEIQL